MAVTVDILMDQLNADDDERDFVTGIFNRAKSYVNLMINDQSGTYSDTAKGYYQDTLDQAILEVATNFYLHRDGATKANYTNSASLDTLVGFIRNPSL